MVVVAGALFCVSRSYNRLYYLNLGFEYFDTAAGVSLHGLGMVGAGWGTGASIFLFILVSLRSLNMCVFCVIVLETGPCTCCRRMLRGAAQNERIRGGA